MEMLTVKFSTLVVLVGTTRTAHIFTVTLLTRWKNDGKGLYCLQ